MSVREQISSIESVVGLTGLGRLADRAALAVHRYETGTLDDDDREALNEARALLQQLRSFVGITVPPRLALRDMGPILVLEETFGVVARSKDQAGVAVFVERLIDSIDSIVAGSGTVEQTHIVAGLFDGLAVVTLDRAASIARSRPQRRQIWMTEALSSSAG